MTSQLSLLYFSKAGDDAALDTKTEQGCPDDTSGYRRGYLRELRWISNLLEALKERSERKRREKALRQVHRIVAQLEASRSCGASRDEILAAAEVSGISREEAEKVLEALHAQGDIFECKRGYYKTT